MTRHFFHSLPHLLLQSLVGIGFFLPEREAVALVPFMDGGVFVHVEATGIYDTNLFANANEEDDFYLALVPAVEYRREAGTLHLNAMVGMEVLRFMEFSDQDTEDLFASLGLTNSNRPGRKPSQFGLNVDWREASTTREDIGLRTQSTALNVALSGRSQVSDRLGLRGLVSYGNEQFSGAALSEIKTGIFSVDGIHIYSDNLETFIGYRYRNTETEGNTRRSLAIDDHLLQIGAEGQLSARTVGLVSLGVQQRFFNDADISDRMRPYGIVSLTWTPRARSEFILLGSKDFAVTPDDRSVDRTGLRLALNQGVYRGFSLEPHLSYTNLRVERPNGRSRLDNRYEAGLGLIYDLASGASTALRFTHRNHESDDPYFDYSRNLIELSAQMTF